MKRSTSFLVRVALMAAALALAVVFVGRGADSPAAEATSYNPMNTVSLSDPTPDAHSDLMIGFSLNAPDAFPNITTKSTTQFLPKQWGITTDAPIGTIAGEFAALSYVGIFGYLPCAVAIPFTPTMHVASVDPSNPTSALDLPGSPGGVGYSGQFADDPATLQTPGDLGVSLIPMNADEMYTTAAGVPGPYVAKQWVYRNMDGSGTVTYGDVRTTEVGTTSSGSVVQDFGLPGGVTRYPDFLDEMFPSEEIGPPILRLWGGQNVILSAISLNIVTFAPGQLPGFPPSLGYASVVVILNPVAAPDPGTLTVTSDLCTPLALTNTNYGMSEDNPATLENEAGIPLLTNPSGQKDYVFTLVTTSGYDADDDGIENWLDTCPLDPNTDNLDGRTTTFWGRRGPGNPDGDYIDSPCDPDPLNPGVYNPFLYVPDMDLDFATNIIDVCPTIPNGIELFGIDVLTLGQFVFPVPRGGYGNVVGVDNQADSDHDHIGDACDPDPLTPTGHTHEFTLERTVSIFKHGIKLDNLAGPKNVQAGGAKTYSVPVSNLSDSPEEIQVALRVLEDDCATVNGAPGQNTAVVSVGPGGSGSASFTVDWAECPDYEYTLQADACHAGDEDAGFFPVGDCPGTSDGMVDNNADDDAPRTKIVTVGSP
jgi:hypothetical protein